MVIASLMGAPARVVLSAVQLFDRMTGCPFTEPEGRVFRTVNWHARRTLVRLVVPLLALRNRFTTRPLLGEGPPVSLTSYGSRVVESWATIESISLGSVRPAQVVLWLDSEAEVASLGARHRRLQRRGLTIAATRDLGPHKKYFPFVHEKWDGRSSMVTADDDVVYPVHWLQDLIEGSRRYPGTVQAHRARVMELDRTGNILPYTAWPAARSDSPGPRVFATGISGVLYPPGFLDIILRSGETFLDTCPRADDVWLHFLAARSETPVRQLRTRARHFSVLPGSQVQSLHSQNVGESGNDLQVQATYTEEVRRRLQ